MIERKALGVGIGGVEAREQPLTFRTNALSLWHQHMPIYDKEMVAKFSAVNKWQPIRSPSLPLSIQIQT